MPAWVDSPSELLTMLTIGGVIIGVLFFIIDARLGKVLKEFKPNGGESFNDRMLKSNEGLREELLVATERIERKIDKHLGWHMDQVTIDRSKRDA